MGVYVKDNAGNIKKLAGYITQKQNARWFLCTRSLEDGIEYYDVPQSAEEYYKTIDAYTIYSFGFAETNTTNYPKLRYETTILDIKDVTNTKNRIEIGQLNGVYNMYTQDLAANPKMYFVGTTNLDDSSSDYQIVTSEPTDKSQGKMIYEKSSGVTLGKAVVDKTAGADQYYSSPADLADKIFGGTAVPSDIETYEYLLFKENEYVAGYINIGNLPELTQYALTHNSIEVIFKVNNGAEQSDILTKNIDGSFGNTSNKFQTMKSQNLVEGAGSDYYTLDLQAGGVAQSFKVAETDTIQITKLKLGDVYINIDKGGSEGPFAIANLKIADGTQYNPLKQLINDGMQEKLTAGTGITIENNIISATAQETQIDNTTITKTTDGKLQAVGLQDETDSKTLTAHDIWLACSIEREV
jgi:hypothetical protein